MVFSQTELLVMIGVVSALLICITILTILDIKEYLKTKNGLILEDDKEVVKEEVEIEPVKIVKKEEPIEKEILITNTSNNNDEIFLEEMEDEEFEVKTVSEPIIEEVKEEIVMPKVEIKEEVVIPQVKEVKENIEIEPEKKKLEVYEEFSEIEDNLPNNKDDVTNFEMEQERTAIISLDELLKKSDELYNDNEIVQYDDGNEPITIDEVISRFRYENNIEENKEDTIEEKIVEPYSKKETIPFISSVYGIERRNDALEFENTANYEKLDREKYNDFIAKLREMNEKE